ncbi:Hpt domain-containing protein [Ramlibacter sp.]|uniref:Hpt domain-containing protein n=1 Tax=Ramlibacter sp. TaxID=1917967 RepID=UPI003D11DB8C
MPPPSNAAPSDEFDDFDDALAGFRRDYAAQLPGKLDAIRTQLAECLAHPEDGTALTDLTRLLHKLAGSAGTFGFEALGQQAKSAELSCVALQDLAPRTGADLAGVARAIAALGGPD